MTATVAAPEATHVWFTYSVSPFNSNTTSGTGSGSVNTAPSATACTVQVPSRSSNCDCTVGTLSGRWPKPTSAVQATTARCGGEQAGVSASCKLCVRVWAGAQAAHEVTYWPGHASVFGATGGSKTAESNTCTTHQMKCVMRGGVTNNMCRSVCVAVDAPYAGSWRCPPPRGLHASHNRVAVAGLFRGHWSCSRAPNVGVHLGQEQRSPRRRLPV